MSYRNLPNEHHYLHRIGWLRATVLGANDGIVSTASLIIGVAAASAGRGEIIIAGIAGLTAGAMSMAAGEFVSVSSQADTERADIETERAALAQYPQEEEQELADIYVARGLEPDLAQEVATQLSKKDALGAHMRDELGLTEAATAQPILAAISSAVSFAAGAALPLIAAWLAPMDSLNWIIATVSLLALALLGLASATAGGARRIRAVARVVLWGAGAMIVTGLIGKLFGTVV